MSYVPAIPIKTIQQQISLTSVNGPGGPQFMQGKICSTQHHQIFFKFNSFEIFGLITAIKKLTDWFRMFFFLSVPCRWFLRQQSFSSFKFSFFFLLSSTTKAASSLRSCLSNIVNRERKNVVFHS